jgi:hypothetical protein
MVMSDGPMQPVGDAVDVEIGEAIAIGIPPRLEPQMIVVAVDAGKRDVVVGLDDDGDRSDDPRGTWCRLRFRRERLADDIEQIGGRRTLGRSACRTPAR